MDLEQTIKEVALDLLAWLAVEEGSIKVILENSLNDDVQQYRVEVAASDASLLIGKNGDTLAAYQHMLRLIVGRKAVEDEQKYQIRVDVDGYRARKVEQSVETALRRAARVMETGTAEQLPAMDAFMRRAVHVRIAADFPDLTTESIGSGRYKVLSIMKK